MEFTLDAKITENRERLKYDLKRIEKISNNYSFYFRQEILLISSQNYLP